MQHNMEHMNHIAAVAARDVAALEQKEATYQGSWKRRGGVGAWMMIVRKTDRLDGMLAEGGAFGFDIFKAIAAQTEYEHATYPAGREGTDGTVLAEVRDLRRYLLLVEAEMVARGAVHHGPPKVAPLPPPVGVEDTSLHGRAEQLEDGPRKGGRNDAANDPQRPPPPAPFAVQEPAPGAAPYQPAAYSVAKTDLDGVVGGTTPAESRAPWRVVVKGDPEKPESPRWAIVDRLLVQDHDSMAHLQQLRRGLNEVEYRETVAPWFQHFYKWDKSRTEWALQEQYGRWAATGHR